MEGYPALQLVSESSWQSAIKNHFKNIMKTERVAAGNGTGGAAVVKPEIKRKCEVCNSGVQTHASMTSDHPKFHSARHKEQAQCKMMMT
ncbi:uncharacterized protein LOC117102742 isoform X3 [Anneissia japonica]|uniref:uncharacterized protein LOC117102742 isoform X3 n=1 Tax=Anneissia japonica TaxID=1529436 RepID=UPI001425A784|nr:uncharacterized protein LOC117102742 isoform X3 [Anneissia japonica]